MKMKSEKKIVRLTRTNGVMFSDVCRDEQLAQGLFNDWLSIIAARFPNGKIGDGSNDEKAFIHIGESECIAVTISEF